MTEKYIYPEGVRSFPPNEKAPSFIKGTLVITIDEFNDWLKKNKELLSEYKGKSQIRLTVVDNKKGGVSLQVDTYKKRVENDEFAF